MRIVKLTEDTKKDILTNLLKRSPDNYGSYEETVKNIVNDIHSRRDAALFEYTEKFDHAKINADNVRVTEAEIEEAYRIREREYLEEDIKNAVEEFCDYWGIPKGIAGGLNDNPDIICKIASLYEKNQDTNVASADTMKEAVKQVLKKEGVWK